MEIVDNPSKVSVHLNGKAKLETMGWKASLSTSGTDNKQWCLQPLQAHSDLCGLHLSHSELENGSSLEKMTSAMDLPASSPRQQEVTDKLVSVN